MPHLTVLPPGMVFSAPSSSLREHSKSDVFSVPFAIRGSALLIAVGRPMSFVVIKAGNDWQDVQWADGGGLRGARAGPGPALRARPHVRFPQLRRPGLCRQ